MTFIQPHKHSNFINLILGVLVVVLLMGTLWLVVLYNHVVNLNHDIVSDKAKLDAVGAENTVLSNQSIVSFGSEQISSLVGSNGLIVDNKPQYFSESPLGATVAVK